MVLCDCLNDFEHAAGLVMMVVLLCRRLR